MTRPFTRGPFDSLPALPRRPHAYARAEVREVEMDSVPFGRVRIHVREYGEGAPLLLVHGLMTSSYSFRYVLESLGARHRLIIPDLPGAGRSDKPDAASYGPRAFATWLGEFQRAMNLRGCDAVGNSMGGYLCMRLALEDPGAFRKLVDVHSPAVPELRLHALGAALAVPGVARGLAWWVQRDPLRWAHANVHYWDEGLKSREEAEEYGAPLATRDGVRAFTRFLRETMSARELAAFAAQLRDRRARREAFPVPLCLIYARQDPMVPPRVGEKLHALVPSAELHWLEDSSHFAHVDSPERLVPLIERFLG